MGTWDPSGYGCGKGTLGAKLSTPKRGVSTEGGWDDLLGGVLGSSFTLPRDSTCTVNVGLILLCEFSQSIQTLKRSVLGFETHKLTDSFGFIVAESSQRPIHRNPLSQVTASLSFPKTHTY